MRRPRFLALALLILGGCDEAVRPGDPAVRLIAADTFVLAEEDSLRLTADIVTTAGDTLRDQRVAWIADDTTIAVVGADAVLHFRRPGETSVLLMADGIARSALVRSVVRYDTLADDTRAACGRSTRGVFYCVGRLTDDTVATVEARDLMTFVGEGQNHYCGLRADSTAWCRGWNDFGQLGNAAVQQSDTLVRAAAPLKFRSLSIGAFTTCGVGVDSVAYCWGGSRLGNASRQPGNAALPIDGAHKVTALDLGDGLHACAVTTTGSIICWGSNFSGQLGQAGPTAVSPLVVPGVTNAVSVTVNSSSSCALTSAGAVFCWGEGSVGQLGRSCTTPCAPGVIPGIQPMRALSGWASQFCGLSTPPASAVYCWGQGLLGDGTTGPRATPSEILAPGPYKDISTWCALRTSGIMLCWGDATNLPRPLPFQPLP